ncbi:hypothetical protein M2158_009203 [Streptomyces sp. SAI-144]|uniref:hypothetical protein n=1 Tax=unclassified Streptomyces TaxID=2593676 RepID=UPI00247557F5|nr:MULTISPECIES: hypothetical protein [unclassified Streptomyces]MDH6440662.1 hypothetical protein [Streptomyces sp. SAI-144]MDH6487959.1 hypothetical protein [Streptomyces sp. SAI-127]
MASSSAGFVTALTTAALATVGFLGYQAYAATPAHLTKARANGTPAITAPKAPGGGKNAALLPPGSGTGARVVYSLRGHRVWLVGLGDKVIRTFKVTPGNIAPAPGVYAVTSRSNAVTGTDGTPIEHVVRFTSVDGVAIGFSAAVRDAAPPADFTPTTVRTGGIRESRADGDVMWTFATIGATVAVIP